jgi:hypothetical protein
MFAVSASPSPRPELERAVECGVTAERVVNTRTAEDLLDWTRG